MIALYVAGSGILLLVVLHILMFMIWWMFMPFTMLLAFMETVVSGKVPEKLVKPECPFMRWWRKHVR